VVPAGAVSHHGAGRSRRPGDQGRAAGGGRSRPPHQADGRADLGVLPQHGPRQEERRARPQERAGPRRSLPAGVGSRRAGGILPARRRSAFRHRLRRSERRQPRRRLLLDQRLRPGRRLSRPRRARSGARSHDRRAQSNSRRRRAAGHSRHSRCRSAERPAWALRCADGASATPHHRQGRLYRRLHARGADGLVCQCRGVGLRREQASRREEPAYDRRLSLLSHLRYVRQPPARDRRPGDEVHQEPFGRARPA